MWTRGSTISRRFPLFGIGLYSDWNRSTLQVTSLPWVWDNTAATRCGADTASGSALPSGVRLEYIDNFARPALVLSVMV